MISEPLQPLAVDISMLTTLEKNPRRGEVKAIMRSLERFGQRKPIVALPNGTVIAGNHTLMAARELGWDEIAVTFSDDDPQTAKAFALADNRTGDLGTYDEEILAELLVEVSDDPELLLATGYSEDDIDALLNAKPESEDIGPTEFPEIDPSSLDTEYCCPSCGYEWSGSPRPGKPTHEPDD